MGCMRRAVPLSLGASQLVGSIILWPQLQLLPPGSCSSSHPDFLSWCVVSHLRQRFEQPCSWWFSHLATGGCLQLYFSLENCTTTEEGSKLHKLIHTLYRADAWVMCFYNSHRETRWNLGELNSIPNCLEIILIIIMVWIWVCVSWCVCCLWAMVFMHNGVHMGLCSCARVYIWHAVHVWLCAYVMVCDAMVYKCHGVFHGVHVSWCLLSGLHVPLYACIMVCRCHGVHLSWCTCVTVCGWYGFHASWCAFGMVYMPWCAFIIVCMHHGVYVSEYAPITICMCHGIHVLWCACVMICLWDCEHIPQCACIILCICHGVHALWCACVMLRMLMVWICCGVHVSWCASIVFMSHTVLVPWCVCAIVYICHGVCVT